MDLEKLLKNKTGGTKRTSTPASSGGGFQMNLNKKLIGGGIAAIVGLFAIFSLISWTNIEGHERAVVQDWKSGVQAELLGPGTHFYSPLTTKIYKYNVGTEKFIMGNRQTDRVVTHGDKQVVENYNLYSEDEQIDFPAYSITTGGDGNEQPAQFSVTLQYQLDESKLVQLHNSVQHMYEEKVIKPALTRIISDAATTKKVLEFYSGAGRVALQKEIEKAIRESVVLSDLGIAVETAVIDDIRLDPQYVAEITGRQIATQRKLRAVEEAAAAKELAKKAKEEAEADKARKVTAAEAEKQEKILGAEAEAESTKQAATADRYKKEQNAKGLLAEGLAQAEVDKAKKVSKYEGTAGARQAAVEIEQAKTERLKNFNVTGVLPEKTALTLIGADSNFNKTPTISIPAAKPESEDEE